MDANYASVRWQELVSEEGFSSECEAWHCLFRDQSSNAIGDLFGYCGPTIITRAKNCGVKMRPRGGRNYVVHRLRIVRRNRTKPTPILCRLPTCNITFTPPTHKHKYHCPACAKEGKRLLERRWHRSGGNTSGPRKTQEKTYSSPYLPRRDSGRLHP